MAASVIRSLSAFGPSHPAHTCFIPADEEEYEEELREEEDEDPTGGESPVGSPLSGDLFTETTDRLLRFAELISSDVQRYFGRSHDSETCSVHAGRSRPDYSNIVQAASSEQRDEPGNLGPLAELFRNAPVRNLGLPMIQRRLPSSFWTEPGPDPLCVSANIPDRVTCSMETISASNNIPVISTGSSSTPDFSDLLEHWASERDNTAEFCCEYQLP